MSQFSLSPSEQQRLESEKIISSEEKRGFGISESENLDEKSSEKKVEKSADATSSPTQQESNGLLQRPSSSVPAPAVLELTPLECEVDAVLEEGLVQVYETLPPEKKEHFQQQGRSLVKKIEEAIQKSNLKLKRLLQWIREWLKIIPHINRFFLEQELKIKSDKIMDIAERDRRERML